MNDAPAQGDSQSPQKGLSYKFQRLRERLRQAIVSGELTGKLPGERILAERFNANAKTLSKALTDLAAEGLLERSIGRGTFVRGSVPETVREGRWLLLCDNAHLDDPILRALIAANPSSQIATDVESMRPSFLNQLSGVVDLSFSSSEEFVRDLVVRGLPVVAVGREPRTYSTHCVIFDIELGSACIGRELLMNGHRSLAAVGQVAGKSIYNTLMKTAPQFGCDAVRAISAEDVVKAAEDGVTAFVADSVEAAQRTLYLLQRAGRDVPGNLSVAAVCCVDSNYPCTGYFLNPHQYAEAIAGMLRQPVGKRPTTLWLAGKFVDHKTTAPHQMMIGGLPAPALENHPSHLR